MKALRKAIRDKKVLIFFDLEGTQFTHEMIEIGAYSVLLHDDLSIKNINQPFKRYVKAKNPVGKIVTNLTGINDYKLQKEGLPFSNVINEFQHYVKKYEDKCTFITFGNHDLKIIEESVRLNNNIGISFFRQIRKNYLDFGTFISKYIKDKNGNQYSLTNYLKLFSVPFEGQAHDALADAYNLIELYRAFLTKKDIVRAEYEKTLSLFSHLPTPIAKVMKQIKDEGSATLDDFNVAVEDSLK